MKNAISKAGMVLCFLLAGFGAESQAEPAVYKNGELVISEGVQVTPDGDRYFRNITLRAQADGSLKLVRAQPRNLVQLDELELSVVYGEPREVEVYASGYKSVACVDLEPVAVSRSGSTFHVLIAETPIDPLALCAQALAPYNITVTLDVADLPAGDYVVLVNNEPMEFTLEEI